MSFCEEYIIGHYCTHLNTVKSARLSPAEVNRSQKRECCQLDIKSKNVCTIGILIILLFTLSCELLLPGLTENTVLRWF